jgi:hypothetical protein
MKTHLGTQRCTNVEQLQKSLSAFVTSVGVHPSEINLAPGIIEIRFFEELLTDGSKVHDLRLVEDAAKDDWMFRDEQSAAPKTTASDCQRQEVYGVACDDCVSAIANDDYTGMSDEQEASTRAGIARIGKWLIVGEELGFVKRGCDVCRSRCHGNKHSVSAA